MGELSPDDEANWNVAPPADDDRTFTLRPQDLDECFQPDEDTWYFPRVAGTFKERAGFHGCQMPEQLLGRIIRTCSNEGDAVLDPFSGSATTLAVAKKLGRKYIGFELSPDYVKYGCERLANIRVGDRLDGSPEPTKSAPTTKAGRKLGSAPQGKAGRKPRAKESQNRLRRRCRNKTLQTLQRQQAFTAQGIVEAFQTAHDGYSADRVVTDPELNAEFLAQCDKLGLAGDARSWNGLLFRLRKAGQLAHIETHRRTSIDWQSCDAYLFASEIALRLMLDDQQASSLDEILCDPALAAEFDDIAARFAPGFTPLEYRWTALKLRKEANNARTRGAQLRFPKSKFERDRTPLAEVDPSEFPAERGVYLLSVPGKQRIYAGETLQLRERITQHASAVGQQAAVRTLRRSRRRDLPPGRAAAVYHGHNVGLAKLSACPRQRLSTELHGALGVARCSSPDADSRRRWEPARPRSRPTLAHTHRRHAPVGIHVDLAQRRFAMRGTFLFLFLAGVAATFAAPAPLKAILIGTYGSQSALSQ